MPDSSADTGVSLPAGAVLDSDSTDSEVQLPAGARLDSAQPTEEDYYQQGKDWSAGPYPGSNPPQGYLPKTANPDIAALARPTPLAIDQSRNPEKNIQDILQHRGVWDTSHTAQDISDLEPENQARRVSGMVLDERTGKYVSPTAAPAPIPKPKLPVRGTNLEAAGTGADLAPTETLTPEELESYQQGTTMPGPATGVAQLVHGYARAMNPEESLPSAGSEMIGGAAQVFLPSFTKALFASPVRTVAGLAAGGAAGAAAQSTAEYFGATPDQAKFVGDVGFFIPSWLGAAAGLRSARIKTPNGDYQAVSVLGGKVRGGTAVTPDSVIARAQVGDKVFGIEIPRGGRTAAAPETSEAAKALASFEEHAGTPGFETPVTPQSNGPQHLTPDIVEGVSKVIRNAPVEQRPNLMLEAHANMVKWMMARGTFIGPDHQVHNVANVGQAKTLASKFINDEVDRVDQQAAAAQQATQNAPTAEAVATSKPTQPPTSAAKPTTSPVPSPSSAPVVGQIAPMGRGMTTDSPAVAKVQQEANLEPGQAPRIEVKQETPQDAAALAQPPKTPAPAAVDKVGKTDPDSGRQIVQPSTSEIENERLAAQAAPEMATGLSQIASRVDGAHFDEAHGGRLRPQKNLERIGQKTADGDKPADTIGDYLASQIVADTVQAKDQIIAELKQRYPVLGVEDNFLQPREHKAGYPSANVQVQMPNGSSAEVQIVIPDIQKITDQTHRLYTTGREFPEGSPERKQYWDQAEKIHEAAVEAFKQRAGIPEQTFKKGSTQINITPDSDLGQAHAAAVASIPDEHLMPSDFGGNPKGREDKPHITVRYGLKDDSPEAIAEIRQALEKIPPFEVPIGDTDAFEPSEHSDGAAPLIAQVEKTPELLALRDAIEGAVDFHPDSFPEYKPHIILGYVKPGVVDQHVGGGHLKGKTVKVDSVTISKKDGSQETIPLGGKQEASAPATRILHVDELDQAAKDNEPLYSVERPAPTFFSKAEKVAEEKLPKTVSAQSVIPTLKNSGVKDEEMKWMGLDDFLRDRKVVSKDELLEFMRENNIQVKEVEKSTNEVKPLPWHETRSGYDQPMWVTNAGKTEYSVVHNQKRGSYILYRDDDDMGIYSRLESAQEAAHEDAAKRRGGRTEFSDYQLPGGQNYRELLLTLPPRFKSELAASEYRLAGTGEDVFHSSHFKEPNVLAHVRFNDRVDADGKKVLFLEEVQSDWHQKGRKVGYRGDSLEPRIQVEEAPYKSSYGNRNQFIIRAGNWSMPVDMPDVTTAEQAKAWAVKHADELGITGDMAPNAPFKTTWHELALKRMLRYAAENGYDKLAWTTGEQQAERYDLSKQINELRYNQKTQRLTAYDKSDQPAIDQTVAPEKLADYVGKDAAEKLLQAPIAKDLGPKERDVRVLRGVDLKVGGQGMKGFYDKIIPDFLNKYGKKWGAKVGEANVGRIELPVEYVGVEEHGSRWYLSHRVEGTSEESWPTRAEAKKALRLQDENKTIPLSAHSIGITPAMRDSVVHEGQPLFNLSKRDIMVDDAVRFQYHPPEASTLFGGQKPPILTISRGARNLIAEKGGTAKFNAANMSASQARTIADKVESSNPQLADALREAADDAGHSGITVHKENATEAQIGEESVHAGQRQLGRGEVAAHLPDEAVARLLDHPAATQLSADLKAQGYPELSKQHQVAEFAAHIATGQHSLNPEQAADWFTQYVDELHREHGEGNVATAFANMYDQAREFYERARQELESRASRPGGSESGIQQSAPNLPEHPTGAAPPETGRGNRQTPEGKQGSLEQPFLLSREQPPETTGLEPGSMGAHTPLSLAYAGGKAAAKVAAEFYRQDLAPLAKGVAGGLKEVAQKGLNVLAPRASVPVQALDTMMRMKGAREEELFRFDRMMDKTSNFFDKMPEAERVNFIDRMMNGYQQPNAPLQHIADMITQTLGHFRKIEKQFISGGGQDLANYFPIRYRVIPKSGVEKGPGGRRPLEGSKAFTKQKTYKTLSDAMADGGVPITTNPIGLVRARIEESLKFTTARQAFDEWLSTPYTLGANNKILHIAQFFKQGDWQKARALRYEQVDDKMFRVLFPASSGEGMIQPGEYWVEENTARLLNNFLSRDLIRESQAGRGLLALKNGITAWRLAWSPFHLMTESILSAGSEIGRGIERSFNQGVRQASLPDIGKGLTIALKAPGAPFGAAREGGNVIRYVTDPQAFLQTARGQKFLKQYPQAADLITDLFTGGAKLAMHEDYRLQAVKGLRQAMADDNYLGAVLRAPGALAQLAQYPMFEQWIPRLKIGMFLREYSQALEDRAPEIAANKLTRETLARQVWNRIDDRFGELNWDNFFWDRTFKTAVQIAFRAFSWEAGNVRFTGSAGKGQGQEVWESVKFLKDSATGSQSAKPGTTAIPRIDSMLAKILGLAMLGVALHSALQYALTGEHPKDFKDVLAPRDGTKDKNGKDVRWSLPIVPFKDAESFYNAPGTYARSKFADVWSAIPEAIHNRDFQDHLISHPSDPYWEQLLDRGSHIFGAPIGAEKFIEAKKRGETTGHAVMGELGLSRAGRDLTASAAEKKMYELEQQHRGPMTDEQKEQQEQRQARAAAGKMTRKEILESRKNEFVRGLQDFSYQEAKQVYDLFSPEEREAFGGLVARMVMMKRYHEMRTRATP